MGAPSYSDQLVTGSVRVPDLVHQVTETDTEGNFLQFHYQDDASQTGYITEEKTLYHSDLAGTDSVSIIRIPTPDGFTFTATGGIKVAGGLTAQYFILFHNAYRRSSGTGYQIIKVVTGTAG